ncbi:hypothetical protein ANCCAN_13997 [Ancylostoma caninum]|uniref:Uncharacterized protein n=1 Tax=Ancylostoma caninum TaxID=29170 RepID=A0A368G6T2_ANCCA|nr:hypothetical protein ANCCAN_13997 [Ancylostoma caninum]
MEVEAEAEPQQHHRKMGPKDAKQGAQGGVVNDSWLEDEPKSNRPASMFDRRSKIPLHVQLMMASGPVNGREVAYYPWDDGKGMDARRSKKESQKEKAKSKTNERRSAKEAGIVQL